MMAYNEAYQNSEIFFVLIAKEKDTEKQSISGWLHLGGSHLSEGVK